MVSIGPVQAQLVQKMVKREIPAALKAAQITDCPQDAQKNSRLGEAGARETRDADHDEPRTQTITVPESCLAGRPASRSRRPQEAGESSRLPTHWWHVNVLPGSYFRFAASSSG